MAGSVNNIIGPRLTLFVGTMGRPVSKHLLERYSSLTGYAVYLSALWVYQTKAIAPYLGLSGYTRSKLICIVVAGGIEGLGAALLWAAQGAIM